MQEIINTLPALGIAVLINIVLGMIAKIGIEKIDFSMTTLLLGVVKGLGIAGSFIGLSYISTVVDITSAGPVPEYIINAAILLYVGKDIQNLMKILGVEIKSSGGSDSGKKIPPLEDIDTNTVVINALENKDSAG